MFSSVLRLLKIEEMGGVVFAMVMVDIYTALMWPFLVWAEVNYPNGDCK